MLEIIFEDGNFGKKNIKSNEEGRPDDFVGSKFHSLKNNFRRLNMSMKYVCFQDRLSYYLGYISESIDRLK
ncbi:MAG: hypothetical protein MJZ16_07650 [Bacteroidales bacterium]|nr:hypothetical protein [Bacteroidales bacterium]